MGDVRQHPLGTTFLQRLGRLAQRSGGIDDVVNHHAGASLDFADDHGPVHPQNYAFLVSAAEWDPIFDRIRARGLPYWADPGRSRPGEFNTNDGGRGVYWEDPSGHFLEIITRPYGSGGR